MSNNSKAMIQRQWHIVLLWIENHYVSTLYIQIYLKNQSIHSEIHTIQRDFVNKAHQIFNPYDINNLTTLLI